MALWYWIGCSSTPSEEGTAASCSATQCRHASAFKILSPRPSGHCRRCISDTILLFYNSVLLLFVLYTWGFDSIDMPVPALVVFLVLLWLPLVFLQCPIVDETSLFERILVIFCWVWHSIDCCFTTHTVMGWQSLLPGMRLSHWGCSECWSKSKTIQPIWRGQDGHKPTSGHSNGSVELYSQDWVVAFGAESSVCTTIMKSTSNWEEDGVVTV